MRVFFSLFLSLNLRKRKQKGKYIDQKCACCIKVQQLYFPKFCTLVIIPVETGYIADLIFWRALKLATCCHARFGREDNVGAGSEHTRPFRLSFPLPVVPTARGS